MNNEELTQKVERLEKALGMILEAVGANLSPLEVEEVQRVLNPPTKLSEAQETAQNVVLLKSYYGESRYEKEFAQLSEGEKAREAWRLFG